MKQHRTLRWGLGILLALTMGLCLLAATALADTQQTADFVADEVTALNLLNYNNNGKAEWDGKTLTLKGVNFAVEAATAVKLPAGSIIVLEADTTNTIKSTNTDNTSVENSYGIYCDGDLTIKGSGTLTVTGGAATGGSVGISVTGNLIITDGTVNANGGGNSGSSTGINAGGTVGITSATVTATGSDSTNNSYGIYARGAEISGSTVTATGGDAETGDSVGIWTNAAVTISGDDTVVTATGGTAQSDSCGIWAKDLYEGDVTISGGTVTATGSNAEYSYGIQAGWTRNITINGGHVTARTLATTATNKSALHVEGTNGGALDLSGYANYQWCTSDGGAYTPSLTTPYTYSATDTYVEFKPGPITCTVSFDKNTGSGTMDDVTVVSGSEYTLPVCAFTAPAGKKFVEWRVNSKGYNAGDTIKITEDTNVIALWEAIPAITGNQTADFTTDADAALQLLTNGDPSKATWDSVTKTLTLRGVSFTTSAATAVKLPAGTIIELVGDNTIASTNTDRTVRESYGIDGVGNLTIGGSGTLTVTGGAAELPSRGIYARNNITITGGTVNANGGANASSSVGIFADGVAEIKGGTVNATGGKADKASTGIVAFDVAITGGTVNATGNTTNQDSSGIYANNGVSISGADAVVTATGGNAESDSHGIWADYGDVAISGGSVKATGNTADDSYGIYARTENIKISGGHVIARTLATTAARNRSALSKAPDLSGYPDCYWRTGPDDIYYNTAYPYSLAHTYVELTGESKTVLNADDLPRTGDDSSILLWTVLLLASVLGVTGTVVYGKRSKYAK